MATEPAQLAKRRSAPVALVALLRPKQYLKNSFVFAAILFSNMYRDSTAQAHVMLAFLAMCMLSSGTYIVNDAFDVKRDRQHPKKRLRPLAAGELPVPFALAVAALLIAGGLGIAAFLNRSSLGVAGFYLGLQVLYNWQLKKQPVADVFTIATGFVLRAVLGAAAISVPISGWLLFFTGSIALMLGFAKRRNEFLMLGEDRTSSRESLVHYSKAALDALVAMFAVSSVLFYAIYSIQSKTAEHYALLPMTVPFVVYGIARYVLLVLSQDEGGEPADIILKDPHILVAIAGFVITAVFAMSGASSHMIER